MTQGVPINGEPNMRANGEEIQQEHGGVRNSTRMITSDVAETKNRRSLLALSPRIHDRLIYRGDRVTESHHVHNRWEPEDPRDVDPESRNAKMFRMTCELTHLLLCYLVSFRFHFSIMKGFINRLCKIEHPICEAFRVFCIMQSLPKEYSPYVFRFMKTCKEPSLMELYEVMCKTEDDLRIIARNKTNKRRAEDKEIDEKATGRTKGFFYERLNEEATPNCDDCGRTLSSKNDEPKASLRA
ncbi:hypothetical protein Tco_0626098 [Tanacetum coccineum]|uniref:Uncharacterized protein n=1 Tax=Tanacetum coccineum TaxID=301880 RepID=A0ABQ4WIN0_9ASTR